MFIQRLHYLQQRPQANCPKTKLQIRTCSLNFQCKKLHCLKNRCCIFHCNVASFVNDLNQRTMEQRDRWTSHIWETAMPLEATCHHHNTKIKFSSLSRTSYGVCNFIRKIYSFKSLVYDWKWLERSCEPRHLILVLKSYFRYEGNVLGW